MLRTRDDLKLPDGRRISDLTREQLYAAVKRLGLPGIADTAGHPQIALAYGDFIAEQRGHQ